MSNSFQTNVRNAVKIYIQSIRMVKFSVSCLVGWFALKKILLGRDHSPHLIGSLKIIFKHEIEEDKYSS